MFRSRIAKLLPLVLVVGLLAPACIVHEHEEADLTFFWTFDGHGYGCDVGVHDTVVEIWDGPHLMTTDHVPCDASGVTLQGYDPGYYNFHIYGVAYDGVVLYDNSDQIYANPGDNHYDVDLGWTGN